MLNLKPGAKVFINIKNKKSVVDNLIGDTVQLDCSEIIKSIRKSLILNNNEGPRKAFNSKFLEIRKKTTIEKPILPLGDDRLFTENHKDLSQSNIILMTHQADQVVEDKRDKKQETTETQVAEVNDNIVNNEEEENSNEDNEDV